MDYEPNAVAAGLNAYLESIFKGKERFKNVLSSEQNAVFEIEIYKDRKIYINSANYDGSDHAVVFVKFGDKNIQLDNKKPGVSSFKVSKMTDKEFDAFKEIAKLSGADVSRYGKDKEIKVAFTEKELNDAGIELPEVAAPSAPVPDPETLRKYENQDSESLLIDKDGNEHEFTDTLELAKFIGLKESFLKKKLAKFTPQELYDYYVK
ncbi:hypothetical protein [Enterococcus sp. AZ180]|uniref:hypothetical protein n=1 Tax=Enterococcus sp. AZ180 TaxID=2774961 RepID=UPI003F27334D